MVLRNWAHDSEWNKNPRGFQHSLKKWNKEIFGDIMKKKRTILKRLNGIARSLSNGPNLYLEDLQTRLRREYEEVLLQEEVLWYQKSRCKWLQYGDRNTQYFHGMTVVRRKRNRIETL